MLHMSVQRSGGFASIRCTGRIVFGDDLHHLKVATWSQGTREVMLDLSRVGLIDAAGLGGLVELHQRFQCAGRKMKLVNPTRFVSHVFKITQLDTVFHIVRTGHIEVARTDGSTCWSKVSQLAMTTVPATAGLVVLSSGF
jgi:anti-anti-sigma factor